MTIDAHQNATGRWFGSLNGLLRDGVTCLGLSSAHAERLIAERMIEISGVNVSVIALVETEEFTDHDLVLAASLADVDARSPHVIEFLFEINLANALAGAGAFGRDSQGQVLLLKSMHTAQLDGMTLAAHIQWMAALVVSVRDELRKLH